MQHSITAMQSCLPHSVRALLRATVLAGMLVMPVGAFARDASLPYRIMPGFQCHQWNWMGECSDWSYFQPTRTAPPAYGGTSSVRPMFPVYRCNSPTVDCTGSISVRGSASPNPVARGDLLTYTIYIRNDDSQNRTVNVRAYLDANAVAFQNATFGGYSDGTTIRWDSQIIPARMSRTIILRVRVRTDARLTEPILLRLQADRGSDSVSVNLIDREGIYDNTMRFTDDGVYVRSGHPPRYRRLDQYTPQYYYDNTGNLHYRSNGPGYYCDQTQYVCH